MNSNQAFPLKLEVEQIENRHKPGCSGSSSTSPLCTCPITSGVQR